MFGKCWSIQYINHEAYKLRDKVNTQPVYFTTKAAIAAIHDWIVTVTDDDLGNFLHITEEFLVKMEPGYYEEVFMSGDASFSIVVSCLRVA